MINELFQYDIDLREKLLYIFQLNQSEPEEYEHFDSEFDNIIYQLNYDQDSDTFNSDHSFQLCLKELYVISKKEKEKDLLLEIIDQIKDSAIRKQYLEILREIVLESSPFEETE